MDTGILLESGTNELEILERWIFTNSTFFLNKKFRKVKIIPQVSLFPFQCAIFLLFVNYRLICPNLLPIFFVVSSTYKYFVLSRIRFFTVSHHSFYYIHFTTKYY